MAIYNLLEYSSNYSDTACSLWFYSKDEATNFNANIEDTNTFKSFSYKTKLVESTVDDGDNGIRKNVTIAVSLKYLSIIFGDCSKCFWLMPLMPSRIKTQRKNVLHYEFLLKIHIYSK